MLVALINQIKDQFRTHIESQYGYTIQQIVAEQPPKVDLGDLAFPFVFELAKFLKKAPRQVAAEIVGSIGPLPGVARVQVAGPGYINLYFERVHLLRHVLGSGASPRRNAGADGSKAGKVILEHTNINPNKTAHIRDV